jgi:membrane protein required for beta-lactamase induction
MSSVLVVLLALLIMVLIGSFFVNAVRIRRDVNKKLNAFRTRLEEQANSVVDELLKAHPADDRSSASPNESRRTASE